MNDGCGKFIKYAVFIVNFLIMLGGLTILGLGIWTLTDRKYVENLLGTQLYVTSAAIVVAMGAIITLISFMGCCGALKEVKCLLLMFFIILLLIFIILLVGTILAFVFKDKLQDYLQKGLEETIRDYGKDEKKYQPITESWKSMQLEFNCCGIKNKLDWKLNDKFKDGSQVPGTCCKSTGSEQPADTCPSVSPTIKEQGCYSALEDFVKNHATVIAGIGIALVLVLILAMIFSCALFLMI